MEGADGLVDASGVPDGQQEAAGGDDRDQHNVRYQFQVGTLLQLEKKKGYQVPT